MMKLLVTFLVVIPLVSCRSYSSSNTYGRNYDRYSGTSAYSPSTSSSYDYMTRPLSSINSMYDSTTGLSGYGQYGLGGMSGGYSNYGYPYQMGYGMNSYGMNDMRYPLGSAGFDRYPYSSFNNFGSFGMNSLPYGKSGLYGYGNQMDPMLFNRNMNSMYGQGLNYNMGPYEQFGQFPLGAASTESEAVNKS